MKLESFKSKDKTTTAWEGLWWHPENGCFSSKTFDLTGLKQLKGSLKIFVKKNKYYNNGKNGRPNYLFSITAFDPGEAPDIKTDESEIKVTDRCFTYEEVQEIVDRIVHDIGRGELDGRYQIDDFI